MSHSRIRRLEILLEFVAAIDPKHLEVFQQAATYDIYSRENAKSRPGFARDLAEFKEVTRKFCKKGKASTVISPHLDSLISPPL